MLQGICDEQVETLDCLVDVAMVTKVCELISKLAPGLPVITKYKRKSGPQIRQNALAFTVTPLSHTHPPTHVHTHLLRPKLSSLHNVLEVVSDNVGLLEEQSHRVGKVVVLPHLLLLKTRCCKQLRETDTHQTSYIVAVLWSRGKDGGGGARGCYNGGGQSRR